ncbi:UBX domain-containing protein [Reticulomyxa filosa]|uniref:UBX domain-containing protein n=2 Tax=Reticulomyxa filosa TaxID=46433 RepID=X6LTC8_RETFI|nr:UBX domain-containing protein [Reticulomyxa filosa]|eukprot:ETO05193.1 UBX domain-containing protein [Reticulomyxa filosa]
MSDGCESDSRESKLQQFKQITDVKNDDTAIGYLDRSNWNCDLAITSWYENKNSEGVDVTQVKNSSGGQWVLDFCMQVPGIRQVQRSLSSVLTTNIFGSTRKSWWGTLKDYKVCYNDFIRQYGDDFTYVFNSQRFAKVLSTAKTTETCIMIYFHTHHEGKTHLQLNDRSQLTPCESFIANILMDAQVKDYLVNNLISWLADLRHIDTFRLLKQMETTVGNERGKKNLSNGLPFVAIMSIHPENNNLIVWEYVQIHEEMTPTEFIGNVLDSNIQQWEQFKFDLLAQREEQAASRFCVFFSKKKKNQIIEIEYEEALVKELSKEEEKLWMNELNELNNDEKQQEKDQIDDVDKINSQIRIENAKTKLKPEPIAMNMDSSKDKALIVKIRINLPDGRNLERQFHCNDKMEQIFYFIESQELKNTQGDIIDKWELIRNFPKIQKFYNPNLTLAESGITHAIKLFVQQV